MRLLNHIFEEFEQRDWILRVSDSKKSIKRAELLKSFDEHISTLGSWHKASYTVQYHVDGEEPQVLTADQLNAFITHLDKTEKNCRFAVLDDQNTTPEGWGYKQLLKIKRYLPKDQIEASQYVYWYHFGRYNAQDGSWIVDKEGLLKALMEEAWEQNMWACPSFDPNKVSAIVQRLPEVLETGDQNNWKLLEQDRLRDGKVRTEIVGVLHKRCLESENRRAKATVSLNNGMPSSATEQEGEPKEIKRFIPKTSFREIGGIDPLLGRIREVIELPLKKPELFKHLHIKPHKGILLYGPPGCGKTMIAKAIAHEIEAHFISVKGPEVLNKYYGQSEENLRKLFEEARDLEPAIIFFDEIDAIAQRRSASDNLRMDARIVNQLLSLMDGVEEYGHICVMAATNRIELIDEALLRPGRFDYKMEIPLPNEEGVKAIFDIQTQGMPFAKKLDKEEIYSQLKGMSGAEIAYISREAAYNCLRRRVDFDHGFDMAKLENIDYSSFLIEQQDLNLAFDRVLNLKGD